MDKGQRRRHMIVHGVSPYVDGIVVKLGEAFLPPSRVTLPFDFYIPSSNSVEDTKYDFRVEQAIVESAEAARSVQVHVENEQTEIDDLCDSFIGMKSNETEKTNPPEIDEGNATENTTGVASTDANMAPVPHFIPLSMDILQPVQVTVNANTFPEKSRSENAINLSDFEKVDDPFETVELQIINDREELKSLFPTPVVVNHVQTECSAGGSASRVDSHNKNVIESDRQNSPPKLPIKLPPISQFSAKFDGKSATVFTSSVPEQDRTKPETIRHLHGSLAPSFDTESSNVNGRSFSPYPPLPSIPPITQPHNTIHYHNDGSLHDPYLTKDHKARSFIDHIVSMGFPEHRVAKAVEKLGQDDKVVVDYLIVVDTLADSGYSWDQAERALSLCDREQQKAEDFLKASSVLQRMGYGESLACDALTMFDIDQDKAVEYLTALSELQQLGFRDVEIKQALLKCNADRDKALDTLTA